MNMTPEHQQLIEDVVLSAEIAHEINRAYCRALGDDSQPAWDDAPEWQRQSAVRGVFAHLETDLTPEQSHEAWMEEKRAAGWSWGAVKDEVAKTHPCIRPYHELPQEQQVKDHLFKAVVEQTLIKVYERAAIAADPVNDPDVEVINIALEDDGA